MQARREQPLIELVGRIGFFFDAVGLARFAFLADAGDERLLRRGELLVELLAELAQLLGRQGLTQGATGGGSNSR